MEEKDFELEETVDCGMCTEQAMICEKDKWLFFFDRSYCYCSSCDETFTVVKIF